MKTLQVIGVIVVLGILLYVAYKFTIGKKDPVIIPSSTRNDKDLSKLTFVVADNFTPQGETFSFVR